MRDFCIGRGGDEARVDRHVEGFGSRRAVVGTRGSARVAEGRRWKKPRGVNRSRIKFPSEDQKPKEGL
jgi:hypothetical protein